MLPILPGSFTYISNKNGELNQLKVVSDYELRIVTKCRAKRMCMNEVHLLVFTAKTTFVSNICARFGFLHRCRRCQAGLALPPFNLVYVTIDIWTHTQMPAQKVKKKKPKIHYE